MSSNARATQIIRNEIAYLRKQMSEALDRIEEICCAIEDEKPAPGRRGRKFMGQEERAEVSRRMHAYWNGRKEATNGKA